MEELIVNNNVDQKFLKREIEVLRKHKDKFIALMKEGKQLPNTFNSHLLYAIGLTKEKPKGEPRTIECFGELPDIDIDFQDDKRDMVFEYAQNKYGLNKTSKLGVVSRYKPRAILVEMTKVLGLKPWDVEELKEEFPEQDPSGKITFEYVFGEKIGQQYLEKYPGIRYCQPIEKHARHFGQHAAALILSDKNLTNYTSIDHVVEGCQIDKHDAEYLNLLKVDCLSLRTLTIIQKCLEEIGKDRQWLLDLPLNDKKAFDIINKKKYHGIFQFEGDALISVAKDLQVEEFNDLVAITSLARPGTLINGEASRYVEQKNSGKIEYQHPILEKYLKETHGIIVYQEQIMKIVKEVGNFSWEETSMIRKAVGKSKGKNFIDKMKPIFLKGCSENGVDEKSAQNIWSSILAMGSYTFNKSHAVAYAMLSYWCMVLKTYYPMEFALATLKDAKSDDQVIKILRELVKDGFEYKVFDPELSEVEWSIKDNVLVGGFTNIKGVGETKAKIFVRKRKTGEKLTAVQKRLLHDAETPFDNLYEFKENFGIFFKNWQKYCLSKPVLIQDIEEGDEARFICKSIKIKQKNINDQYQLEKRNGEVIEKGCLKFVDITLGDDTDTIKCRVSRENFERIGKQLLKDKLGSYYIVMGRCCDGFKFFFINEIKKVEKDDFIC